MVNLTTCPHVSLGILGNQPVEGVLLVGGVEGDGLHVHQVAVLPGLALGELGTGLPKFPRDHIGDISACFCVYSREVWRPAAC